MKKQSFLFEKFIATVLSHNPLSPQSLAFHTVRFTLIVLFTQAKIHIVLLWAVKSSSESYCKHNENICWILTNLRACSHRRKQVFVLFFFSALTTSSWLGKFFRMLSQYAAWLQRRFCRGWGALRRLQKFIRVHFGINWPQCTKIPICSLKSLQWAWNQLYILISLFWLIWPYACQSH